jgi:hypothetical protein
MLSRQVSSFKLRPSPLLGDTLLTEIMKRFADHCGVLHLLSSSYIKTLVLFVALITTTLTKRQTTLFRIRPAGMTQVIKSINLTTFKNISLSIYCQGFITQLGATSVREHSFQMLQQRTAHSMTVSVQFTY